MIQQPQEIEVWFILPAIRKSIAKAMSSLSLKQKEIAQKLHITDAAVSQYINSKRASDFEFSIDIQKEIQKSAQNIISGHSSATEIQKLCRLIKNTGFLCKIHKKHEGSLKGCKVCIEG